MAKEKKAIAMEGKMTITEARNVLSAVIKEIGDCMGGCEMSIENARELLLDMGRTPDGELVNSRALELHEMLSTMLGLPSLA